MEGCTENLWAKYQISTYTVPKITAKTDHFFGKTAKNTGVSSSDSCDSKTCKHTFL